MDIIALCLGLSIIIEGPAAKFWLTLVPSSPFLQNRTKTRAYRASVHLPLLSVRLDRGTAVLEVRERFVWFEQSSDHIDILNRHGLRNAPK